MTDDRLSTLRVVFHLIYSDLSLNSNLTHLLCTVTYSTTVNTLLNSENNFKMIFNNTNILYVMVHHIILTLLHKSSLCLMTLLYDRYLVQLIFYGKIIINTIIAIIETRSWPLSALSSTRTVYIIIVFWATIICFVVRTPLKLDAYNTNNIIYTYLYSLIIYLVYTGI